MRSKTKRKIGFNYDSVYYKPQGIPLTDLKEVIVAPEELETLRLRYVQNFSQHESARKMGISQSQYQRDLVNTLKKITKALISGDAINLPDSK